MVRSGRSAGLLLRAALGLLAAAILVFLLGTVYYTDWLWFASLGFTAVYWKYLTARFYWAAVTGVVCGSLLFLNLVFARPKLNQAGPDVPEYDYPNILNPQLLYRLLLITTAAVTIGTGFFAGDNWPVIEAFRHQTPFGTADPVFGKDIGFFVFALPFWRIALSVVIFLLALTTMLTGLMYLLGGAVKFGDRRITMLPRAKVHFSILLAAFFLVKAGEYRLNMYNLLYSPRGVVFGASYTDIHAQLPALRILTVIAFLCAGLLLFNLYFRSLKPFAGAFVLLLASSLLLGSIYPGLIQQFVVEPNEIAKETPYIEPNISGTRLAYCLDRIAERDFPVSYDLSAADITANAATVDNVRLWDWRPLLQTFGQLQEIRPYYRFSSVDSDRYTIGGQKKMVMIAARELDQSRLQTTAQTWVNQYLKYTHGYGIVASPAATFTSEGLPEFYIDDIPPQSIPEMPVRRPEIYFGELNNNYVIVNTKEPEFDYPSGEQNIYSVYEGSGGVPLSSALTKAAFAFRFRSYRLLISGALTNESRVLFRRNINQMVRRIAPFLHYDSDPYIVLSGGRLYWIVDAYTTSDMYPYSEPYDAKESKSLSHLAGVNYIRNSVKVMIDAYEGNTVFYLTDPADPVVRTYGKIFPTLFRPLEEMPNDIRAHIRYPIEMFTIQATMYRAYHMEDTTVFYNKEDFWDLPKEKYAETSILLEPFYTLLRLSEETEPEFVLMLPFTPVQKKNLIAWLAARSDPEHYGELIVYRMPKSELVYGPEQIEGIIDQDAEISQSVTLWSSAGSQVIRGNLLILPIENSLLYVEPLFLQSTETQLPQLKRVIVSYGNQVVMAETLGAALETVFGREDGQAPSEAPSGMPPAEGGATLGEMIERANTLYTEAQSAIRAGDWAGYGKITEQLGTVLQEMRNRAQE
jgi:uncharacterized membrane protein (UPF0182 family)